MTSLDKLPKKYEISFENIKYPHGTMSLIYSVSPRYLIAKVSKKDNLEFSTQLSIHEKKINLKLEEKGYPVPRVENVYKIFHKDLEYFVPGLLMEDKKNFVILRSVPGMYYNYFKDFYHEILSDVENKGFFVGDTNEGNCLCNLSTKKICLIDFEEWDYEGRGKKILSPKFRYLNEN
jgi:hypothetical protein